MSKGESDLELGRMESILAPCGAFFGALSARSGSRRGSTRLTSDDRYQQLVIGEESPVNEGRITRNRAVSGTFKAHWLILTEKIPWTCHRLHENVDDEVWLGAEGSVKL